MGSAIGNFKLPTTGEIQKALGDAYNNGARKANDFFGAPVVPVSGAATKETVRQAADTYLSKISGGKFTSVGQLAQFDGGNKAANKLRARLNTFLGSGTNSLGITNYKNLLTPAETQQLTKVNNARPAGRPTSAPDAKSGTGREFSYRNMTPEQIASKRVKDREATGEFNNRARAGMPAKTEVKPNTSGGKSALNQIGDGIVGAGKDFGNGIKAVAWDGPKNVARQTRDLYTGFTGTPAEQEGAWARFDERWTPGSVSKNPNRMAPTWSPDEKPPIVPGKPEISLGSFGTGLATSVLGETSVNAAKNGNPLEAGVAGAINIATLRGGGKAGKAGKVGKDLPGGTPNNTAGLNVSSNGFPTGGQVTKPVRPTNSGKPTGAGYGASDLRPAFTPQKTPIQKVSTSSGKNPVQSAVTDTLTPAKTSSSWSFGSAKVKTPDANLGNGKNTNAVNTAKVPVTPTKTRVTDPVNPTNKISSPVQIGGKNNIVSFSRNRLEPGQQWPMGQTPNRSGGINPIKSGGPGDLDAAATAASRTPKSPNPGKNTATLEPATATQPAQKTTAQPAPVVEQVATPPLLNPQKSDLPVASPKPTVEPIFKPVPNAPEPSADPARLVPLLPKASPTSSTATNPGAKPDIGLTPISTAGKYTLEPQQFQQTVFAEDVRDANLSSGTGGGGPTDGKHFYFLKINNKNDGPPKVISTDNPKDAQTWAKWTAYGKPQAVYIGRLDREPVALISKENAVTLPISPDKRVVLKGDAIQDRQMLEARVTTTSAGGKTSGLTIGNYEGSDLKFPVAVSDSRGIAAQKAVATKLGEKWLGYLVEAKASISSGSVGRNLRPGEISDYAVRIANTKIDAELNRIRPDGTTQIIQDIKAEISKSGGMPNIVLNRPKGSQDIIDLSNVWNSRGNIAGGLLTGGGLTAAGYTIGNYISGAENSNDIKTEGPKVVGGNAPTGTASKPGSPKAQGGYLDVLSPEARVTAKQFENAVDNPDFQKKWGKYVESRSPVSNGPLPQGNFNHGGQVTAWKESLFTSPDLGRLKAEMQQFYETQAQVEGFDFAKDYKRVVKSDADLSNTLSSRKGFWQNTETNNAFGFQNPDSNITYTLNFLRDKYRGQITRTLNTLDAGESVLNRKISLNNSTIPTSVAKAVGGSSQAPGTGAATEAESRIQRDSAGANSARVIAEKQAAALRDKQAQRQLPPGTVGELNRQLAEIRASSTAQRANLNNSIKSNNNIIASVDALTKSGKPQPANLVNYANNARRDKEAAVTELAKVDQAEINLTNGAITSYNGQISQKRQSLEITKNNLSEQIREFDSTLESYKNALTEATRTKTGDARENIFSNAGNLELNNGFFKVNPAIAKNIKDLVSQGAISTGVAGTFIEMKGSLPVVDSFDRPVPKPLNATPSRIKSISDVGKIENERAKLVLERTRTQTQINLLDPNNSKSMQQTPQSRNAPSSSSSNFNLGANNSLPLTNTSFWSSSQVRGFNPQQLRN